MSEFEKDEIKDLASKFKDKLNSELDYSETDASVSMAGGGQPQPVTSREYNEFKKAFLPKQMTWYEKACNYSEKIFKIKPSDKDAQVWQDAIDTIHINITPSGVASFAILGPLLIFLIGALVFSALIPILFGSGPIMFFVMFFAVVALIIYAPLRQLPVFMSNNWKMKASSQMVLCIFYVVTYMRHTSNLELAVEFASQHLSAPLNLDLRKVLWDVETEKYGTIQDSLAAYLDNWKETNMEFVESFHLIEGSLLESDEDRRVSLLDKSLSTMLDETYEKMLHYAQNLQQPITMLNMMGIILPILGLVILPLVVSFMEEVKWYHISTLYNIFLPILVYYLGTTILASRPSGYGQTDIADNPALQSFQGKKILGVVMKPLHISIIVAVFFLLIGVLPLILNFVNPTWDIVYLENRGFTVLNSIPELPPKFAFLEYKCPVGQSDCNTGDLIGPFGLFATLLSLSVTLAIGVGFGLYYHLKSANIIEIRNESKKLEKEFASALFQLGNTLGDGFPAEMAFGKVAQTMEGTISGKFFELASNNVKRLGMSVEQAVFDPNAGALAMYPSNLIESSMKVLTESVKKGPKVAAQALINISQYIKEMHKVNERLQDLMAENIASIKGQIKFLTPAIAGIVIGITSMVTTILGKLTAQISKITSEGGTAAGGMGGLVEMFKTPSVPTYYFQIVVGLYVVQIIYILTVLANGIENGADKLSERYEVGKNLLNSTALYVGIGFVVIFLFNLIAASILRGGV